MQHSFEPASLGLEAAEKTYTPLHVLQELGAWAGAEMVQRYAHLSTEHVAHWVKRRTGLGFSSVACDNFPTLENKTVN